MKKLYFFDESERERILNLHESATKNQYLINEQETSTPAANIPGVTTTAAATPDNQKIAMEKGYGPVSKEKADELASQGWPAKPKADVWSKFPCVPKHPKARKSATSGGQEIYFIPNEKGSDDTFYNNGTRIFAAENGKTGSYTCQDPIFKSGSRVQASPEQSRKGYTVSPDIIKKLQDEIVKYDPNYKPTGTLDQTTLDALNKLLS